MSFQKMTCSNCNAQLDVDMENMQLYCPYCGQKLMFDSETVARMISEKEKTTRSKEKTKRTQIEYDYKDRKDKRASNADLKILLAGFAMIIFFIAILCIMAIREDNTHKANGEIKLTFSSKDIKGTSSEYASSAFEKLGFTNIDITESSNLLTGITADPGEVTKVEINGDSRFDESDWYPADSEIRITYYKKPD